MPAPTASRLSVDETIEFTGRIVFLGASTLESTRLLLNSTSPDFPDGLANSSGALGDTFPVVSGYQQLTFPAIASAVAAGFAHSLVLDDQGRVWSAGANSAGQLGDASRIGRGPFAQIPGLTNVSKILNVKYQGSNSKFLNPSKWVAVDGLYCVGT